LAAAKVSPTPRVPPANTPAAILPATSAVKNDMRSSDMKKLLKIGLDTGPI
jgi:hypothetical protein